jgi:TRAP-type mannitol/chloroaromatic compound transport system permease small subunit
MIKEDEDIYKYIVLMNNFYDKVTNNHVKKDTLKKAIQTWKQQANNVFTNKVN